MHNYAHRRVGRRPFSWRPRRRLRSASHHCHLHALALSYTQTLTLVTLTQEGGEETLLMASQEAPKKRGHGHLKAEALLPHDDEQYEAAVGLFDD